MENWQIMKTYALKIWTLSLFSILFFQACLLNDDLNQSFDSYTPLNIEDGLEISNPEEESMDSEALISLYEDVYLDENLWSLRSLLVFRNNKLVSESYLKDNDDISNRHLIWSCTKQVMGILTGIAIEENIISSIDDPISNYFDQELSLHSDKADISIHNLIRMQSGIDYNNDGVAGETDKMLRQIPENSIEFILDRPMLAEPGTLFHYNDGDPHLMSALIQKKTGIATDAWADEVLFSKLNLTNYNWIRYKDGVSMGGYGIETTPRELAKIALCVAGQGNYYGTQVVSSEWIEQMTHPQVQFDDADFSFGYYWWIDEQRGIHFMWGHGGQFAFIVPAKDLVVVMTSIPNTQGKYQILADEALVVVDRIIELCN